MKVKHKGYSLVHFQSGAPVSFALYIETVLFTLPLLSVQSSFELMKGMYSRLTQPLSLLPDGFVFHSANSLARLRSWLGASGITMETGERGEMKG